MGFKVGHSTQMVIANVADQSKEAELKRHDFNKDGILNVEEASSYYSSKTGGDAPRNIDEVFGLVGGRQHDVQVNHQGYHQTVYSYAPHHKGNFNVPGMGAGNIRTGTSNGNFQVLVDCDLMNRALLDNDITEVNMIIGPKGFSPENGSTLGEAVAVPMNIATQDSRSSFSRGGGSTTIPEKKLLATSVDVNDLKSLNNGGDLSFYVKFETKDGKSHYINKDGQAFQNFNISGRELTTGRP